MLDIECSEKEVDTQDRGYLNQAENLGMVQGSGFTVEGKSDAWLLAVNREPRTLVQYVIYDFRSIVNPENCYLELVMHGFMLLYEDRITSSLVLVAKLTPSPLTALDTKHPSGRRHLRQTRSCNKSNPSYNRYIQK